MFKLFLKVKVFEYAINVFFENVKLNDEWTLR